MTEKPQDPTANFVTGSVVDGAEVKPPEPAPEPKAEEGAPSEDPFDGISSGLSDPSDDTSKEAEADDEDEAGDEDEAEDESEKDAAPAPKKNKVPAKVRIGELTRKLREAERARELAEARLSERAATQQSEKKPDAASTSDEKPLTAPSAADYEYGEVDQRYLKDLAEYHAKSVVAEERKKWREEQEQARLAEAAAAQQRELSTRLEKHVADGRARYKDFDAVVQSSIEKGELKLSRSFAMLMLESEVGPDVAYYLAKRPGEVARLQKLPEHKQLAIFGRLEGQLEARRQQQKNPPKVSKAPAPVTPPRGAGGRFETGFNTTDFAAVEAKWRKQHSNG